METLDFKTAFKYTFNRPKGMLNIFWVLLPIIGWFALGGYSIRIVQSFTKGEFEQLPIFDFSDNFRLGFFMFIKSIPFVLLYIAFLTTLAVIEPWLSLIRIFTDLFIIPILAINFFSKETVGSLFEFKILKHVFSNFSDYIITLFKTIMLSIVFVLLIIVLVGIPAGAFTKNMFLADFYRRNIKV